VLDAATIDGAGGEPEPVPGAFSMLDCIDQGIATKVRTRARAGHAYALWYVIVNAPESCSDGLCGTTMSSPTRADHSAGPNAPQIARHPRLRGLGGRRSGGQPGGTPEARRGAGNR
jgi:hypothetical protein